MKKSKLITLILFLMYSLVIYADYNQVKLISSNDDYGLEFDWMQFFNTDAQIAGDAAEFDKDGNMYLCGKFSGDMQLNEEITLHGNPDLLVGIDNFFVMKIDPNKNIKWAKAITPAKWTDSSTPSGIMMLGDDHLIFTINVSAVDLYYDSELFYEYDGDSYENPYNIPNHSVMLKINTKTGDLEQSLSSKPCFSIDMFAVGKDGNIYLTADMVKDFCGINKDLPSDCRSTGKYDKYIAKLTPDFKLIWDFTINETYPYDGYGKSDSGLMSLIGDSLYIVDVYCSDIQINPDKSNPIYAPYVGIKGEEQIFENVIVACYNVSGEKPVLEKYHYYDANYEYKCPHIEELSTDKHGNLYGNLWVRGDGHCGIKFKEDLSYDTIRTMPLGRAATYGLAVYRNPWKFNENKNLELNFYGIRQDKVVYINDTLSIPFENCGCEGFAKYDSDQNLRYVLYLMEESRTIERYFSDDNHGGLYFVQESYDGIEGTDVNWSLSENVDGVSKLTSPHETLIKYTETFRIREELSDKGRIKQAGEMVRFGSDVKIEVLPKLGYEVDSVVTSSGLSLAKQEDGTFLLPDVRDRVILKAHYSPSTSAVEELEAEQLMLYPNPATDRIHISTIEDFYFVLTDMRGRKITEGETSDGTVNITSLASGCYLIQINNDKIVKFEKK